MKGVGLMKVLYCDRCGKEVKQLFKINVKESYNSQFDSVKLKEFEVCRCCQIEYDRFRRIVHDSTSNLEIKMFDYFMKQKGLERNETN